ncbi:hypothetical protein [Kitasatospora cathayae]|uniref:Uncharacterized protein n=1 Tax=Kitasatospora cathayae TaxID=3004092 RepID=A0ABY7PZP9_9ACTN|nr:hypothetical protein [Kitasatospora sp. HUAS 3-15]WBP85849.1 hypothetical protein O1G21_08335 [Kitasatospora sp. HUAS 3-15]
MLFVVAAVAGETPPRRLWDALGGTDRTPLRTARTSAHGAVLASAHGTVLALRLEEAAWQVAAQRAAVPARHPDRRHRGDRAGCAGRAARRVPGGGRHPPARSTCARPCCGSGRARTRRCSRALRDVLAG